MKRRRFAILDRDGTLNVECEYLSRPQDVALVPGAIAGLKRMRELGLGLVVATNQSGIGRGYFTLADVEAIHARLAELLLDGGVTLDALFVCPHLPDDGCDCRKPNPGLVQRAAEKFGFDPREAFVIGDKPCDIDLGERIGATTILVRTGYGHAYPFESASRPTVIVDDLEDASRSIAARLGRELATAQEGLES